MYILILLIIQYSYYCCCFLPGVSMGTVIQAKKGEVGLQNSCLYDIISCIAIYIYIYIYIGLMYNIIHV